MKTMRNWRKSETIEDITTWSVNIQYSIAVLHLHVFVNFFFWLILFWFGRIYLIYLQRNLPITKGNWRISTQNTFMLMRKFVTVWMEVATLMYGTRTTVGFESGLSPAILSSCRLVSTIVLLWTPIIIPR